jgi:DNA repair photolyase
MPLIYEPAGRAREYAALACNIYRGCDHACEYCYAPAATRRAVADFHQPVPRPDFLKQLRKEAAARTPTDPILLCFTCDPYQALDERLGLARETIKILHAAGHAVNVLTKGGSRALRDLDLFGPQDAFATTLTLLNGARSFEIEPGASMPSDRIVTIREFHAAGIPTWVSLEPVLDPAEALAIIRLTHSSVDLFKVGRWNYDARAEAIDWAKFAADAVALLESLGKRYYIKRDLACFLPEVHRG